MNSVDLSTPRDPLLWARRVLNEQAFSAFLGTQMDAFASGQVTLALPIKPELLQQHGFVHGGVISYLADNALTFAGGSVLGDSVTSEYKINYLRPAMDAERLVAVARVLGSGKSQAVCSCDVYAQSGTDRKLVAVAQGTIRKATGG
jgi:uncharacterized protein (TIGR00369 family)